MFDYDQMGRLKAHRQIVGTQTYNLEYGYNLAGQLTSEKYPSGRIVSTVYDASGRLSQISDQSRTYANNFQFQGNGTGLSAFSLGNGTNQTFSYNDRLQMENQTLAKNAEILQKYNYGYGQTDSNGVLKNNGKLAQVESFIGAAKQWTQKFSYDAIGRLSEAEERRGDTDALSYKQKFDYDNFGNLYRKQANNPTGQQNPLPTSWIEDSDISKQTNRLTTNTQYDDAGNVTQDTKFRNLNYSYDANGRMYKTSNSNQTNQSNAVYDALGQRVAQQIEDVWTFFVYDISGKMIAEYGGLQATDEGGIKYVLSDWQGSSRAIVGNTGVVKARMDYAAFGEEINAGVGLRTPGQGFSANTNLSQKYAQTERDKATGLDHTTWRKLENQAGRWTSPDPYNGSMNLDSPQSFNRYSYVENQPTNFIDPSGLNMEADQACSYSGRRGSDGELIYDGTIRNGRCESTSGSSVQVYWYLGSVGGGGPVRGGINNIELLGGGGGGLQLLQSPTSTPNRYLQRCIKDMTNGVKSFVEENSKPIDLFNLTLDDFTGNVAGVTVGSIVGGVLGGIAGGLGGAISGAALGAVLGYISSLVGVWAWRILIQFAVNAVVRTAAIAKLVVGTLQCYSYPGDRM